MAVEADLAVEVKATVITVVSTHITMMGACLIGAVQAHKANVCDVNQD
jgi:hypothetical protein